MYSRRRSMRAGLKKGAHYSAPMYQLRVSETVFGWLGTSALVLVAVAGLGGSAIAASAAQPEADARKTEAELQAVKAEIERVTGQVSEEQVERDKMSRELRAAEVSVGKAREGLDGVRRGRAECAAKRSALAAEKRGRESDLQQNRGALSGQLRAAYLIGREEPLKLLLNQQDPAQAGRMFVYYSYFGRARAEQIHGIETDVQTIATLDDQLQAEDAKLAELEKQQRAD